MTQPTPRPVRPDEEAILKLAAKEPFEAIGRLEESARHMMTATATVAGLFLAVLRWAGGTSPGPWFYAPFICWSLALIILVLAISPRGYVYLDGSAESLRETFARIGRYKYHYLQGGVGLFIAGLIWGIALLVSHGGAS